MRCQSLTRFDFWTMGCGQSYPELSAQELSYLEEKTKLSEEKIKRMHQAYFRICPSGQLTKAKFCEMYTKMFPGGKSSVFFHHLFRSFDRDKSGTLSFTEFMVAAHLPEHGTPEEILELSFRLYDIDGNQQIEPREIAEILKALYSLHNDETKQTKAICDEAAKELVAKMDMNKDGVLSKEEFISGCLQDSNICKLMTGR